MSNLVYMKPKKVGPILLYRTEDGTLMAEDKEGRQYQRVKLVRELPHSFPDRFISIRSELNEEIILLHEIGLLDDRSQRTAREELQRQNMVPAIKRITSIRKHNTEWNWQVDTDFGRLTITMDNLLDHVHAINAGRWIITDMDGRRYMLSKVEDMDAESQRWWINSRDPFFY
ncbi:DUF1854 domain-containing protein [Paenibacillus lignilyticus]|uniref:DUF1854 domain-containing protein n=1 Tax=Paenibacillus lignilyticus TaxID=1172615 RepID=A0ABS5C8Q4_9BACL|nr:DUF1854 domain-containing protein [Paenibacillus lignilyticus]MBP3962384.1 DUF1854 domain-containing protein [Paenibacillus lignilyticus]